MQCLSNTLKQSNQKLFNSVGYISQNIPLRKGNEGNLFFYKEKEITKRKQWLNPLIPG